ncbi:CNNM domain-containing protein [Colwellia sp. RSH04]|uniref:CNNM domain-containing protein n=1 Tax=Colwellia sp. RSH04 TaxID=2305464 RepID=UPI000E57F7B2|nr:CNNM domain-containing protein [Colwellia sp. RSH04]RHW77021.1 DUF21 domain-containing protein [Colwellia sp. RSH04]
MSLLIIYLLVAIGVSFLCSILEAVLLSVTPTYVAQKVAAKARGSQMLSKIKGNLDQSISSILILNTFAHTMGAAGVGAQAIKLFGEQKETLIAFLLTLAILYFSEIIPKTLGATFWRTLAIPSAYIISILIKLVYPLVWLSSLLTQLFSKKGQPINSREELKALTAISKKSGNLDNQESLLLENILQMRDTKTQEILTPRSVVHALEHNVSINDAITNIKTANFTRIPIYEDSIDNITGVIIKNHLYEADRQGKGKDTICTISTKIGRVSESLPVLVLLDLFIKRHEHIFVVEDHFGQTAGVVTLEDAIETFLGREIVDETDEVADLQKLAKSKYRKKLKKEKSNSSD